jgi:protein ImuB
MNALNLKTQVGVAKRSQLEAATASLIYAREVWVSIHFPEISLAAQQTNNSKPFAVLVQQQGKTRIYALNERAQQSGIEPGMLSSAAYALCQGLGVAMRDERTELQHLQAYARRILRLTPRVVLSGPDILLLEVKASLRLFGGLKGLHRQLEAFFTERHTTACAPVVDAAELMARCGIGKVVRYTSRLRAALGEIHIANTAIEDKLARRLANCGLYSLRDVWRLPRPDLARRFGPGLLDYLDQLCGERHAPRHLFETAEVFKAKYDFDRETDDQAYLLYAAEVLLKQASVFLQARASLSEKISFYLRYAHRHEAAQRGLVLNVYAQQGGDRPEHFLPQLGEQLQNRQLVSLLSCIELRIDQFKLRDGSSGDLFKKTCPANDGWPVLLGLLFARFGRKRVYRLSLLADFRPEKAWEKYPAHSLLSRKQIELCCVERPTWLFRQPGKCLGGRFKLISDAERIESGWWDDQDQRREYYRGVAPSGRHCWLYRDLQATDGQWYLHGLFA